MAYPFNRPTFNKVRFAVLSDSILKYCHLPGRIDLCANRGANTTDIIELQKSNSLLDWRRYHVVLIHAGTNDVAQKSGKHIHKNLKTLVDLIKADNPDIDVIISSILLRSLGLFLFFFYLEVTSF